MEDAHVVASTQEVCIVGVFDGHGGAEVARFVARHLPSELYGTEAFQKREYAQSLVDAFHRMDELLPHSVSELETLRQPEEETTEVESEGSFDVLRKLLVLQRMMGKEEGKEEENQEGAAAPTPPEPTTTASNGGGLTKTGAATSGTVNAGCTAVVALLAGRELFIANAGDSRAVLCRGGTAVALSDDHKPGQPTERQRIIAAGGFLSDWGGICRVNGNLSLSRAIGDLKYKMNEDLHRKDQIVTAEPEVRSITLTEEDAFLVLACDGIWDVKENQEVVDFVAAGLAAGRAPTDIASDLLDECVASDPRETRGIGADNMTCAVLLLKCTCEGNGAPGIVVGNGTA